MFNRLDWNIVREHIAPFFFSIALIMLLFTLNLAFRMLGRIVGQGLEPMIIAEFFFLNLAWIITLAVPMGVLLACLMAFGRFAGDLEVVAMKASGISLLRMIRPVLITSFFVAAFSLYFQDQILPDMNHRNKLLTQSIRQKRPHIALREGIFTRDLPDQTILVKEKNEDSDILKQITIFDESNPKQPTTVVADSGRLAYIDTLGMYRFKLFSGEIHQMKRDDPETYEVLQFREAIFRFDSKSQLLNRREEGYRGDRELGLAGLQARIDNLKKREERPNNLKMINKYKVEYHKKFTISIAAIVFVFIGAPLGVRLHRGGLGVSGGLSVFFFLLYWSFLIAGEDLADREILSPWLAMWLPNILLFVLGIFLVWRELKPLVSTRSLARERKRAIKRTEEDLNPYATHAGVPNPEIKLAIEADQEDAKESEIRQKKQEEPNAEN
ncbi:LptF/LptG family permease [bacterium]|nr:LptF/LptG family permease [bacterium]